MRIRGEQLYLFSGELTGDLRPIALSTDCALRIESSSVEVARQHSAVRQYRKGLSAWAIDCSNLISEENFLRQMLTIGQPILIAITLLQREAVEAGIDISGVVPDKMLTLVGRGLVIAIAANGPKGQMAATRITFQGSGEIGALVERNGFPYVLPIVLGQ